MSRVVRMLTRCARNEYTWVGVAFVVAVFTAYLVLQSVTTGSFDRLERQQVRSQADRIRTSLGYETSLIDNFVLTNAVWDDPYNAITNHDPAAARAAFPPQTTRQFGFSGIVLLDHAGAVVGGGRLGSRGGYAAVSASLAAGLRRLAGSRSAGCGVLAAAEAHYLYCAAPVVHTSGSGPPAGTLVAMRTLDAAGMAVIGRRAGLEMGVSRAPVTGQATRLPSRLGDLRVQTRAAGPNRMELLVAVPATAGGVPLVLDVAFDRPVHHTAAQSAVTSAEVIGVLGIALLVISILAQRAGHRRRNRLFVQAVEQASSHGGQVSAPGRELATLAASVNDLLDRMAEQQLAAQRENDAMAAERAAAAAAQLESDARTERARAEAAEAEQARAQATADAQTASVEAAALARRTSAAAARQALGQIHATLQELAAARDRIGTGADRTLEAAATAVQRVDEAMRGSGELQQSTDAAAEVTREISAVADQTRLLALNAAIEAARAGEHGRGFAVVAHEVGELAQAAGGSAERVLAHIRAVTAQSSQVAASIEATSTALAAVNAATREIEQSVMAQRTAEADTETTLTATTERLVQISERRANVRVAIDVPVRAVLPADGAHGPIDTVTTDLSLGGALMEVRPGMGEGPWEIELFLPDDPRPVHCTAELVHRAETHYGVAFANFPDTDLLRLDSTIQHRLRQTG